MEALSYDVAGEVRKTAVVSDDGRFRYLLVRHWDPPVMPLVFVMLNPSTADAEVDDPTIRRCMGFARDKRYGGIRVVNLFAYRATDPHELSRELAAGRDVVGPANDDYLHDLTYPPSIDGQVVGSWPTVVAAWGAHHLADARARAVYEALPDARWHCLGTTKDGRPRHPLYLPAGAPLDSWSPPQSAPTRPQLP